MDYSDLGPLKQLFVDSLADCALVLLDSEGKVLTWNAGAEELLGYTEEEAVGRSFSGAFAPGTTDATCPPASLAVARNKGRHEEISWRRHSDGSERELWEIVIPLYDPQLQFVAFGVMMRSLGAQAGAVTAPLRVVAAGRRRKVLLVDDDGAVRATSVDLLTTLGYEVLVAASGLEALDILARVGDVDVLFTDVIMPGGMDGGEVADQAKRIRPGIKILFQSGYFEGALVRQGNISANTHLLVKPYRRKDLAQMMNMILADEVGEPDVLRLTAQ